MVAMGGRGGKDDRKPPLTYSGTITELNLNTLNGYIVQVSEFFSECYTKKQSRLLHAYAMLSTIICGRQSLYDA